MMKNKKPKKQRTVKNVKINLKRHHKRKILSFWRVCRYGMESFFRNSWLSVAATIVMIITLLIIFSAFVVQDISTNTINELRNKVDMSIYLNPDTDEDVIDGIVGELKELESVVKVSYISSDMARQQIAEDNADNVAVLEAIKEATNKTPATLKVVIKDINDTSELEEFVASDGLISENISDDYKPSFAGDRRENIQAIGRAVGFAQKAAIAAGTLFVVISSLIIFNTIQMAIFNRKEEIQMMKLIGADKSFIRGPFLVESIFYGIIAAIFASGIGIFILYQSKSTLEKYFFVEPTINFVTTYALLVTIAMIFTGAIIGMISSLFATRKYLKI